MTHRNKRLILRSRDATSTSLCWEERPIGYSKSTLIHSRWGPAVDPGAQGNMSHMLVLQHTWLEGRQNSMRRRLHRGGRRDAEAWAKPDIAPPRRTHGCLKMAVSSCAETPLWESMFPAMRS